MATKKYASYAEIDRDLEILRLERQIHLEKLKLSMDKTKENVKLGNLIEGYFDFSKEKTPSLLTRIARLAIPSILNFVKNKTSND